MQAKQPELLLRIDGFRGWTISPHENLSSCDLTSCSSPTRSWAVTDAARGSRPQLQPPAARTQGFLHFRTGSMRARLVDEEEPNMNARKTISLAFSAATACLLVANVAAAQSLSDPANVWRPHLIRSRVPTHR